MDSSKLGGFRLVLQYGPMNRSAYLSYEGCCVSFEKLLELLLMLFVVSIVNLPISMPVSRPPVKSDEVRVLLVLPPDKFSS